MRSGGWLAELFSLCAKSVCHLDVQLMFFPFLGLGKTAPDPTATTTLGGVEVPLGNGISTGINDTCLLYNEYPLL